MEQDEMTNQEMAFLHMSYELSKLDLQNPNGTFQMFLKYSPDSLKRLFDLCVVKPCFVQVFFRL